MNIDTEVKKVVKAIKNRVCRMNIGRRIEDVDFNTPEMEVIIQITVETIINKRLNRLWPDRFNKVATLQQRKSNAELPSVREIRGILKDK